MTAKDYPVSFAYGDVDGVYYTNLNPHRGNDRACPEGTPVVIGSTTIGWTGTTGMSSGPHLHIQAGRDQWCQQTIEPSPYEFMKGTVAVAGWGDQWGNYIIIKTIADVYTCYAHLSNINVHEGQVIGDNDMTQDGAEKLVSMAYRAAADVDPTNEQAGYWVERIRNNPNTAYELLAGLGGANYQGDPRFREKARNYDRDVAEATGGYVETKVFIKK